MVASAAAPQLKSVFCSTRLANRRSRILSTFLLDDCTAGHGGDRHRACPCWAGEQHQEGEGREAHDRMTCWTLEIKRALLPRPDLDSEASGGLDHYVVLTLVVAARQNVGVRHPRAVVHRVVHAGVVDNGFGAPAVAAADVERQVAGYFLSRH